MRDLSDVTLRVGDFVALAELCRADRDFPFDFLGWQTLISRADADAKKRKLHPEPLLLDVAEFAAWCTRLKIVPCLDALRAFVIVKRREVC